MTARVVFACLALSILAVVAPSASADTGPEYVLAWGTRGSGEGQFNHPFSAAVNASGDVYVVDRSNFRIQKFTGAGAYLTGWGSPGSSPGSFFAPMSVTVGASGAVYVADSHNARVQKFTSDGAFITAWGGLGSVTGVASTLHGEVYVLDEGASIIHLFDEAGASLGTLRAGSATHAMATDTHGNLYVADGDRIRKFSNAGVLVTEWGGSGAGPGEFSLPHGIAVDNRGTVYVADTNNHRIQVFGSDGEFVTMWGSYGTGPGEFDFPWSVAVSASGRVYVTDGNNDRVQVFRRPNRNPVVDGAIASLDEWAGDGELAAVSIGGVYDPDGDPVSIASTGIRQDEPVVADGEPATCPDGALGADGAASVRREHGTGYHAQANGRVYHIDFTATDSDGAASQGVVTVCVSPSGDVGGACVDDGPRYSSLAGCRVLHNAQTEDVSGAGQEMRLIVGARGAVEYSIAVDAEVDLSVFDVAGRRVATVDAGPRAAGAHRPAWDPGALSRGVYFYCLRVAGEQMTRKAVALN